jgi:hypothetical protein
MQSIMTRRFLNQMRARYLARAGVQIALADLSAPDYVKRGATNGILRSTHEFPENERVETAVFPAGRLGTPPMDSLLSKPQQARLQAIYDALPMENPDTGNALALPVQPFRMIIVAQGRAEGVRRVRSTATVAVLTEQIPSSAPSIICWLEL